MWCKTEHKYEIPLSIFRMINFVEVLFLDQFCLLTRNVYKQRQMEADPKCLRAPAVWHYGTIGKQRP